MKTEHPALYWIGLFLVGFPFFTQAQTFTDIAPDQGISVINSGTEFGCGVSFADFDQDGWDDLSFATRNQPIQFFRNNEGVLEPITLNGIDISDKEIKQITWVDYDNDGDMDFACALRLSPIRLYRNDGNLNFTLLPPNGITQDPVKNRTLTWGDYDKDGDLDLYVGKDESLGTGNPNLDYLLYNRLFRNDGNDQFTDVTLAAGVADSIGITYAAIWWDYDRDGWPDLFTANDKEFINGFYRNNGDGTFEDLSEASGLGVVMDAMSASPADYDRDGDVDLYVSNTFYAFNGVGNVLFANQGDGSFSNEAANAGVTVDLISWGASWLDYDNDGWEDLHVAANANFLQPGLNPIFHNNGNGTFTQSNAEMGMADDNTFSYATAIGDLNNDGFPDLVSNNGSSYNARLWLNSGGSNHWIKIRLQGVVSNKMGVGAVIECYNNGSPQIREVHCGENFMGQHSYTEFVGLGTETTLDSIMVYWPSGHVDQWYDIQADQVLTLTEGSSIDPGLGISSPYVFCTDGESLILQASEGFTDYLWSTQDSGPVLEITESGTYSLQVTNAFGLTASTGPLEINIVPNPEVQVSVTDESCFGLSDGSISLNTDAETSNVEWLDGAEGMTREGLSPGEYEYTLTDIFGCSASGQVLVAGLEELIVSASVVNPICHGDENGSISVSANFELASVAWSNDQTGEILMDLSAGTYSYLATDVNGCITEGSLDLEDPAELEVVEDDQDPACFGEASGSIELSLAGGTEIAEVTWNNGNSGSSLFELMAGTYAYELTDLNGCQQTGSVTLSEPPLLQISINPVIGSTCPDQWNCTLGISGGTPPFQFSWNLYDEEGILVETIDQQTSISCVDNVVELVVVDDNECTAIQSLNLNENGVAEQSPETFRAYPNPVDGLLWLDVESEGALHLFDGSGGLVLSTTITTGINRIELPALASGIYNAVFIGKRIQSKRLLLQ